MFTGIIDHCGTIVSLQKNTQSSRLEIASQFTDLQLGESICIDGICVTVTEIHGKHFSCDISPETTRCTTANYFTEGKKLNLERSLLPTTRMGGHFVQGHVDQIARVKTRTPSQEFILFEVAGIDKTARGLLIKKGSVAVNGVSLTINDVSENSFSVMLIPHSLDRTTFSQLQEGDYVNIEFDMMVKIIVERFSVILSEAKNLVDKK